MFNYSVDINTLVPQLNRTVQGEHEMLQYIEYKFNHNFTTHLSIYVAHSIHIY